MPHSSEPRRRRSPADRPPPRSGRASRAGTPPRRLDRRPGPQRALGSRDDLAVELLPLEPAAAHSAPSSSSRKLSARCIRFAAVGARVTTVPGASDQPPQQRRPLRRRRHHRPRPRCRAAARTAACPRPSTFGHFASSSHQAASNCGPRKLSGLARREGLRHRPVRPDQPPRASPATPAAGRAASRRGCPTAPNTITSRASSSVSPTRATREHAPGSPGFAPSTCARTHSAPARVLPAPRPPRIDPGRPVSLRGQLMSRDRPVLEEPGQGHQGIRHSVRRGRSRAHLAAAQTERRATISARAASRSSCPVPPAHSLLRLPNLPRFRERSANAAGASLKRHHRLLAVGDPRRPPFSDP